MPPFDFLNPLRRVGTGIRRGVDYLGDQLDPTRRQPMPQGADVNPAELDHVRQYLTPGINGQPNPASRPRTVMPNPNAPMTSDRPPAAINTRPVMSTPGPSPIPGGEPPRPAMLDREIAPPPKNYQHRRADYRDEHGKRGFKEILKSGLYGMAASGGQGGLGGLIGGFAGGALGQAIAPQQMAEARFAMGPGRRVLADQQMQRDDELYGLKVRGQEAQIEENRQQAEAAKRQGMLHNVPRNNSVIDPTGKQIYQAPQTPVASPRPAVTTVLRNGVPTVYDYVNNREVGPAYVKPSAENDAGAYREAGLMFPDDEADAIARDSTEARRPEIISKLPAWAQSALNDPMADPEMYKVAKSLFDDEYNRVLEQNKAYTRTVQKQKRLGAAKTSRPSRPVNSNSAAPRNLSDLERFLR